MAVLSLLSPPPTTSGPREIPEDTLRQAQRGDAGALRKLVETYQDRVFGLVGRMLGRFDPAMVEDLSQECFLRGLRALPRFDPSGRARLSTWLLTIATRLCLDHLRRARRDEPLSDDAAAQPAGDDRMMAGRVESALCALSPELRATLLLRTVAQLSVAEAAVVLGINEGTVKSRLSRALAQLRETLGGST